VQIGDIIFLEKDKYDIAPADMIMLDSNEIQDK
jgi:hypothetical protein